MDLHLDTSSWVCNKLTEFLNGHEYWGLDVTDGELYHLLMGIFDIHLDSSPSEMLSNNLRQILLD